MTARIPLRVHTTHLIPSLALSGDQGRNLNAKAQRREEKGRERKISWCLRAFAFMLLTRRRKDAERTEWKSGRMKLRR